jgi:hypothetical protein
MLMGLDNRIGNAVLRKQIGMIQSEIGVVIAGANVLIGIALIIAFI